MKKAIVVGASAGGIEALKKMLLNFPKTLKAPLFLVLHSRRTRQMLLPAVIAQFTHFPVMEAEDKVIALPDHIYVAPPDYHLLVEKSGALSLNADDMVNWSRPSIDVLFESAADVYGNRLTGIVLSGANNDGAKGAKAIAARGGNVIVQTPSTAEFKTMPEAVLRLVPEAEVAPPEQIGVRLLKLLSQTTEGDRSKKVEHG